MSNTATISLRDFRKNAQQVIDAVEKGKTFTVIKHSRPVLKLSKPDLDEWGEKGRWTSVGDFREIFPKGVSVDELLDAMKEIDNERQKEKVSQ
jgi:prevent-host-death family protein